MRQGGRCSLFRWRCGSWRTSRRLRVDGRNSDRDADTALEEKRGGLFSGFDEMEEEFGAGAEKHEKAGEEEAVEHSGGIGRPDGEERWCESQCCGQGEGCGGDLKGYSIVKGVELRTGMSVAIGGWR